MKLEEALPLLRGGQALRRARWDAGSYIRWMGDRIVATRAQGDEGIWSPVDYDVMMDDWEVASK